MNKLITTTILGLATLTGSAYADNTTITSEAIDQANEYYNVYGSLSVGNEHSSIDHEVKIGKRTIFDDSLLDVSFSTTDSKDVDMNGYLLISPTDLTSNFVYKIGMGFENSSFGNDKAQVYSEFGFGVVVADNVIVLPTIKIGEKVKSINMHTATKIYNQKLFVDFGQTLNEESDSYIKIGFEFPLY